MKYGEEKRFKFLEDETITMYGKSSTGWYSPPAAWWTLNAAAMAFCEARFPLDAKSLNRLAFYSFLNTTINSLVIVLIVLPFLLVGEFREGITLL